MERTKAFDWDQTLIEKRIHDALVEFLPLFEAFERTGFKLYAVGGCVRDWALGRIPKDIDFTTDALPTETKGVLQDNGYPVIPVGEVFGTIATTIEKKTYEITTFRVKESYTRGSRHPVVCYGRDLPLDLERRDLTINAMAATKEGQLIDPFGGLEDLKAGVLRVPRSSYARSLEIFGDDPLRILRLARFKARLGFEVSPDAMRAACDCAGSILSVSRERWFSEIDGLLSAAKPESGLLWLDEIGVLPLILPEMALLHRANPIPDSQIPFSATGGQPTLWAHVVSHIADVPAQEDFRWCALLDSLGYSVCANSEWAESVTAMLVREICARLKFSTARIESILRKITPMPDVVPTYRMARELAMQLSSDIASWLTYQSYKLRRYESARRTHEEEVLSRWRLALLPYMTHPESIEIRLPKNLSRELSTACGVSGKTLGLYLAHCRDAVLDQLLSEDDEVEKFVELCRKDNAIFG